MPDKPAIDQEWQLSGLAVSPNSLVSQRHHHQFCVSLALKGKGDFRLYFNNPTYKWHNEHLENYSVTMKGEERDGEASRALPPPRSRIEGPHNTGPITFRSVGFSLDSNVRGLRETRKSSN